MVTASASPVCDSDREENALGWLHNHPETDDIGLLRSMVCSVAEELMGAEAGTACDAPCGQASRQTGRIAVTVVGPVPHPLRHDPAPDGVLRRPGPLRHRHRR